MIHCEVQELSELRFWDIDRDTPGTFAEISTAVYKSKYEKQFLCFNVKISMELESAEKSGEEDYKM